MANADLPGPADEGHRRGLRFRRRDDYAVELFREAQAHRADSGWAVRSSGFWVNRPKFMVSLLKAFYGEAATKDNEFGYQWLPKRASADAYSHPHMFVDMYNGVIKGFLADGQNPAVGGPNAKLARSAMQRLDGMVVKDIFITETAEVWKAPGTDPKAVKTEVFFLPTAPAAEKDGSLTNTMRLIQWHEKAVGPPGDVTSDAEFFLQPRSEAPEALRRLQEGAGPGLSVGQLQVR